MSFQQILPAAKVIRLKTGSLDFPYYVGRKVLEKSVTIGVRKRAFIGNDEEESPVGRRYRWHPVLSVDACHHRNLLRKSQLSSETVAYLESKEQSCMTALLSNCIRVPHL